MFSRQKRGEREFQVETRACADPRDKKDRGIKVLGMVSFHFWDGKEGMGMVLVVLHD